MAPGIANTDFCNSIIYQGFTPRLLPIDSPVLVFDILDANPNITGGQKMRRRILSLLLVLMLLLPAPFSLMAENAEKPDKPVLTAEGVYEISTPAQFLFLSRNYGSEDCPGNGYYQLTQDLDMSGISDYKPFGRFYGTFDGNYHAIINLSIVRDAGTVGLFTYIGDNNVQAVVKNLGLVNVFVSGGATVGPFAGMHFGTLENCFATGNVVGTGLSLGGLVGRIPEDTSGTIKEPKPEEAASPTIRNCYSLVNVRQAGSGDSQGGIAGRVLNPRTLIENCYAAGFVYGDNKVGGLVGDLRTGILKNSVAATPYLFANQSLGSAAGRVLEDPTAPAYPKALAEGILSYGQIKKSGEPATDTLDGRPASAEELYQQASYEALGWDFEKVWEMRENPADPAQKCPVLRGFSHQKFTFDLNAYLSSVAAAPAVEDVTNSSIRISVTALDEADAKDAISAYSIVMSPSKPDADHLAWQEEDASTFDGLDPSTEYTFWVKAKTVQGKESAWTFLSQYTKYLILTDKTPKNISQAVSENPSTSLNLVWTTENIELENSVAELVRDSGTAPESAEGAMVFEGSHAVQEVNMTTNEKLIDGIRNFHRVPLTGLEPGTSYYYRVGDKKDQVFSPWAKLKTAPAQGDQLSFAYITDPQIGGNSKAFAVTAKTIETMFPQQDFVFIAGDATEKGYSNGQWDLLFEAGQNLFMNQALVMALGNHDAEKVINRYVDLPHTVLPCVYSFDYGPAHFMVLNTEYYEGENLEKQLAWLKEDATASGKQWKIVMLHKALYAATDHVDDEDINALRVSLAPVLEELKIDVVLMGHDHNFSRGFVLGGRNAQPEKHMENGTETVLNPRAPLYFLNGTAGDSKWYNKINYDPIANHVSPDYEFIDKSSGTYEDVIREQSFSIVTIDQNNLRIETFFLEFDKDNPDGYKKAPYPFDAIRIIKK